LTDTSAFLKSFIQVADTHAQRMQIALTHTAELFPIQETTWDQLSAEQISMLDMLTTRFGKLQDIIGSKIFPLMLNMLGENDLSFKDKLNKLEKLKIIKSAQWWMKARELRNQIAHDYPDNYEILSAHLNDMLPYIQELALFWMELKQYVAVNF